MQLVQNDSCHTAGDLESPRRNLPGRDPALRVADRARNARPGTLTRTRVAVLDSLCLDRNALDSQRTHTSASPGQAHSHRSIKARTDDELVLLARGGSEAAFDALVRRYQRKSLGLAARLVGKWSLAPDITQETFLQLYRALPTYQPCGRFSAYLSQIVVNQCRMARRRKHAEDRSRQALSVAPVESPTLADAEYIAREDQSQLQRALESLNASLRVVAVLRYGRGLSYGEIADKLSIPIGTVKRRLYEAGAQLRQVLAV